MSQHDGVSCDSCLKRNFCGKRYKCLICLDYDLCSVCHDSGNLSGSHTINHPMQCILTRNDSDLYFAGEISTNALPFSFTCPICGRLGFTDATLYDHVNISHNDNSIAVVCPICATLPDGEPNQVTHDFLNHLNLQHRNTNKPQVVRIRTRNVRVNNYRNRTRSQLLNHQTSTPTSSNSTREAFEPIAHLLSQLSDVRRVNNSSSNEQPPMWQFPMGARPPNPNRSSVDRMFRQRRPATLSQIANSIQNDQTNASNQSTPYVLVDSIPSPLNNSFTNSVSGHLAFKVNPNYLLNTCALMENDLKKLDTMKADRSIFVQELILACLSDSIQVDRFMDSNKSPVVEDDVKSQFEFGSGIDCDVAEKATDTVVANHSKDINTDDQMMVNNNNNNSSNVKICKTTENDANSNLIDISGTTILEQEITATSTTNTNLEITPVAAANVLCNNNVTITPTTTNFTGNCMNNEQQQQQSTEQIRSQKSIPTLVTPTTGPSPPPPQFIVSSQMNHSNSRNNKVSKVRSSPAIAPSLTIRHSGLTSGPGSIVSPGGRRKIFKQPTEPPPHYD